MHVSLPVVFLSLTGHNNHLSALVLTRLLLMTWAACAHTWKKFQAQCGEFTIIFFIIFLRPELCKGIPKTCKLNRWSWEICGKCIGNMSVSTDHEHSYERHLWTLQEWEGLWLRSMSGWFCHHLAPSVFIQSFRCQNRLSLGHIAVCLVNAIPPFLPKLRLQLWLLSTNY